MSLRGFNLLQNNEPPDAWDKIYDWVTNTGRVIVIVVELIVVASFFVRIVVDTQTKNLQEEEKQLTQTLLSLAGNESKFRDYQERFNTFRAVWNGASSFTEAMNELNRIVIPARIDELSININGQNISIRGIATGSSLKTLEEQLRASTKFASVRVPQLESGANVELGRSYNISIEVVIKNEILQARTQITS